MFTHLENPLRIWSSQIPKPTPTGYFCTLLFLIKMLVSFAIASFEMTAQYSLTFGMQWFLYSISFSWRFICCCFFAFTFRNSIVVNVFCAHPMTSLRQISTSGIAELVGTWEFIIPVLIHSANCLLKRVYQFILVLAVCGSAWSP